MSGLPNDKIGGSLFKGGFLNSVQGCTIRMGLLDQRKCSSAANTVRCMGIRTVTFFDNIQVSYLHLVAFHGSSQLCSPY